MASRRSRPSSVRVESKDHKAWREAATKYHQNMFETFSVGPSKTGYHVVRNGENLGEKIKIAIFGCDFNRKLKEEEKKMITDLREKVEKLSPKVYRKNNRSVLAIVYVQVFLNNDNVERENHVLFRVPKFVEVNVDGKKKKKEETVNFTVDTVEIEYVSGEKTVYNLKDYCDSAYFIDTNGRVYTSWAGYKKKNLLPKGRMCLPQDGVYKAGEDGKVMVETVDTPACNEGALELLDASSSLLGKVGAGICVVSAFTPISAAVCWGAVACVTASSLYNCGRSVGILVDRGIHEQDLRLSNKDARHLWIDSVFSGLISVAGSNTSTIISSVAGVLQEILTRVIDHITLNNWDDMPSIKNVFCLFLNNFLPVEQIKKTLSDIANITNPIFNVVSSVGSFDKLTTAIKSCVEDLMDIVVISGKFLYNVTVGLFDKRFSDMHKGISDLLSGRINLVDFALKVIDYSGDIWEWFKESFKNAKLEYRQLCNEKTAKNIIRTVGLEHEENRREMFRELDNVIKVCEVDNRENKHMESLIKLVDKFRSKVGADSTCNEFLHSVRVVCAFVNKYCKEKKSKYETQYNFQKELCDGVDFDKDEFNKRFGIGKNVDPATHFFAQAVGSLQTENQLSEMYESMAARNANKAIPSTRAKVHEVNTALHDRLDQEQYNRRYNLRILGIPESEGENTDELVVQLAREKLKININQSHIDYSHRLGKKRPRTAATGDNAAFASKTRPRPIIVRFTSYRARRKVFCNKKHLKNTPFVVKEDLTKERMDVFKKATELYGARQVWSLDGVIHWRDKNGVRGSATRKLD